MGNETALGKAVQALTSAERSFARANTARAWPSQLRAWRGTAPDLFSTVTRARVDRIRPDPHAHRWAHTSSAARPRSLPVTSWMPRVPSDRGIDLAESQAKALKSTSFQTMLR